MNYFGKIIKNFLEDQTILIHTEPDISVIENNKNDSLRLMFPIALAATVFAFVAYGAIKYFAERQ